MILFIYEGKKTEPRIFNNIKNIFFSKEKIVEIGLHEDSFGGSIYDLYFSLGINNPDFDISDLDIIELMKNRSDVLKEYSRDDFSEIYLFFDLDIQRSLDSCQMVIKKMLELFDNETENGKLYINYPMVESLKDIKKCHQCNEQCFVNNAEVSNYKEHVGERSEFLDIRKFGIEEWEHFTQQAVKKTNCVMNGRYLMTISYRDFIETMNQINIFGAHEEKFFTKDKTVILNSIPLFLLEYFGETLWDKFIKCPIGKYETEESLNCSLK